MQKMDIMGENKKKKSKIKSKYREEGKQTCRKWT